MSGEQLVLERLKTYYPQADCYGWLTKRNALLGQMSPKTLIQRGMTERVLRCIDRMDSGRL